MFIQFPWDTSPSQQGGGVNFAKIAREGLLVLRRPGWGLQVLRLPSVQTA